MPTNRQRLITVCYLPVCSPLSCFLCCAVIIILYLCTYSVRHNRLHDHNNYNSLITCNYFHLLFETFRISQLTNLCKTLAAAILLTSSTHFGARLGAFFYWTGCFENNVPFDNTAQLYLINLHWKLGLGFKLRLRVALF